MSQKMKHTILCVDDEIDNVEALERIFRKKYTVLKATSAAEGLALLQENNSVALIISDQRMPKMTGVQFLKESLNYAPQAIRILLTGYTDVESVIDAINSGEIYRYITKPWDPIDLANTIDRAIEKFDLTAELKEKNIALKKAFDELKTLDDAKNNFMVLINHELKTPLTVILSFLELTLETALDEDQKKYLNRIGQSADRLKKIIDDVLAFVSAETGLMRITKKKISSAKLIGDVVTRYEREAGAKLGDAGVKTGAGTTKDASKSSASTKHDSGKGAASKKIIQPQIDVDVKLDPNVITEVIYRLLDNAMKFGIAKSDVIIDVQSSDPHFVEFSVTNEGPALAPETIEKILKPFTLDEDILKHSQGLGLGLSLTQALLKRHSSSLAIESHQNRVRASFKIEK
jgi:signal transduction histidine kinase